MVNKKIGTRSYHPLGKREPIACMIWGINMERNKRSFPLILTKKWGIKRWIGDAKSLQMIKRKKKGEIRGSH